MNQEAKVALFLTGVLVLVAVIFGVQAWTGKRLKKEFGGYAVEEMDEGTRTFHKWVSIAAFVAAGAWFLYTRPVLRSHRHKRTCGQS